jgi:hypothetical protein
MKRNLATAPPLEYNLSISMSIEEQKVKLTEVWQTAASRLSVRVEAPYLLKSADGAEVMCVAFLPDFGGTHGTVVGCLCSPTFEADKKIARVAKSVGTFYSFMNFDIYSDYNEERFKEALIDWGFYGSDYIRPNWLQKPTKNG